ncbi:hypothetical protein CEN40_02775 [Fischerella thermalis CCMEE 5205]|nr:hypothetical protein CEN40_02775 [Fischerella thermalis CCMEE 5205]
MQYSFDLSATSANAIARCHLIWAKLIMMINIFNKNHSFLADFAGSTTSSTAFLGFIQFYY